MQQTVDKAQFAVLNNLDATMVELPYKGDRIVMQVVQPCHLHHLSLNFNSRCCFQRPAA
jgi:serine protease inhibitor